MKHRSFPLPRTIAPALATLFALGLSFPCPVAAWAPEGSPACTAPSFQHSQSIIADGQGGSIVAWLDERSGTLEIYAQRLDPDGNPLWTPTGVPVRTLDVLGPILQGPPRLASDGAGGAIITWDDTRFGNPSFTNDIYAQRIDASGNALWTFNGVPVCVQSAFQGNPQIIPDDLGGAVIVWEDSRNGSGIFAQRINSAGLASWTPNGVDLFSDALLTCERPVLTTDGTGGAIVAWEQSFPQLAVLPDIYAQRVNGGGVPMWPVPALSTASRNQLFPQIVSDGQGGAIVAWQDDRALQPDVYAQKVSASGAVLWTADGVALCTNLFSQDQIRLVPDGAGGAIATWRDARVSTNYDVYAQRISSFGTPQWTYDGVPVCVLPNSTCYFPEAVADGSGGVIVTWQDDRNLTISDDIYAQRLSGAGFAQWTTNGIAVCEAENTQYFPSVAADGFGGVVIAWLDSRTASGSDIFAQRMELDYGTWGRPEPILVSASDVPSDEGGRVAVNWTASGRDLAVPRLIGGYSVWRATDPAALNQAPPREFGELLSQAGPEAAGAQWRSSSPDYYWELVAFQDAFGRTSYSYSAATRADSVELDPGTEYFQVLAHDANDPYVAYASGVVSGYSVDNLAPGAPAAFGAQRIGSDVQLTWGRVAAGDLGDYAVYRSTSPGVATVPANLLASVSDTAFVDVAAPSTDLYYVVAARDIHGNQGLPSGEAALPGATGAIAGLPVSALTLLPNRPNPFAGSTEISFALPEAADVEIQVWDVGGRRVQRQLLAGSAAGWHRVTLPARDDQGSALAPGVYFYRVRAGEAEATGKMAVRR